MSGIGADIGKVVQTVVPGVSLGMIALRAVGALIAVVFLGYLFWKVVLADGQALRKTERVTGELATRREAGANQAGQDTVRIVVDNNSRAAGVDRQTQEVLNALLHAKGADQAVDPELAGIARSAICMRASATSLSSCRKLLEAGP